MPDTEDTFARVWDALSEPRLAPYMKIAQDRRDALALYEWSARTASAAFEVVGHLEVLLRNAMDAYLREHFGEEERGIPWFLLSAPPGGEHVIGAVTAVRQRLQQQEISLQGRQPACRSIRESRHQIVAGLEFGFWTGLLGSKYEDLWRGCLHRAFPNSSGKRKSVSTAFERVRKFRNRLAHHDSMINVDVPFEIRQIIEVARYIDSDAAEWLAQVSRAMDVYAQRPIAPEDTVAVAARDAWPLYLASNAYVCQAGRSFRDVNRIAFYTDREIKEHVPEITHRRDNVEWSPEEVARLGRSANRNDRKISSIITASRAAGWTGGRFQVFLLTQSGDARHRELRAPLPHEVTGRGSAYTQGQRYVSLHALETAKSTADL
ncbi:hypothetical protein ACHZ98_21990 [Streptomyces sp. MAR4 CNY-716]